MNRVGAYGITSYYLMGGMKKTAFRFRLYPNHKQERRLLRMIETSRRLWNDALFHRKGRWEERRVSDSDSQQCWILTAERRGDPLLGELYSQAGQEILRRLDRAFTAFFEHRARYPRFKKFSSSGSFTYPQAYNGSVKPDAIRGRIFVSKVGNVKAVFHRRVPPHGKPKTCTVVREPNGEWYASLVYEDDEEIAQPSSKPASPVGIDLGLKSLLTTTDGVKIPHPRFLRKAEGRLNRLQRSFSRTRKGSENRVHARLLVAVQHAKVANQRADFNHKLSAELVRRHDLIAFEDLKVRNMVRNYTRRESCQPAGSSPLEAHDFSRGRMSPERDNYGATTALPKLSDYAVEEAKLRKLYDQARAQGNRKKKKEYKEKIAELNRLRKYEQRESNKSKN